MENQEDKYYERVFTRRKNPHFKVPANPLTYTPFNTNQTFDRAKNLSYQSYPKESILNTDVFPTPSRSYVQVKAQMHANSSFLSKTIASNSNSYVSRSIADRFPTSYKIKVASNIRLVSISDAQPQPNYQPSSYTKLSMNSEPRALSKKEGNRELIDPLKYSAVSKCNCSRDKQFTCRNAEAWLGSFYHNQMSKNDAISHYKYILERVDFEDKDISQIEKDLHRTHPNIQFFKAGQLGNMQLRNILRVFSAYDTEVGYVQGMNFIAASLLFHAEEPLAFWLFLKLFEKLRMKDIFIRGLPGIAKHIKIFEWVLQKYEPEIASHLEQSGVVTELYLTEWIISFGGYLIPLEFMSIFYDGIFSEGWPYFYKVMLVYLMKLKSELLQTSDMDSLEVLKRNNIQNRKYNSGVMVDWVRLLNQARQNIITHQDSLNISFRACE